MIKRESFGRAIASSVIWGTSGKFIGILKHVVVAGAIGLSAQLDSYFAATSIITVFVFLVAGMFDILGVPILIALKKDGNSDGFNRVARSLFSGSLLAGVCSFLLIIVFRENLTVLAQGFDPARKQLLVDGLVYLAPLAFFYFPLRQLAAIHRAEGHYSVSYQADFLVTFSWFLIIVVFRDVEMVLFFSWPIAVAIGLLFLIIKSPFFFSLFGNPIVPELREIWRKAPLLALLQGILALHVAVDYFFASYLPVGGLGSLSLAMVVITALVGVLRLDTSYISVFGHKSLMVERNISVNKLISFCLMVGIPYMVTLGFLGNEIIRVLFERGVFTSGNRNEIALVLATYAPAVLTMILLPPIEEIYQVMGKIGFILIRALLGLMLNCVLCYLFIFVYDLGNFGIALSTAISMTATLLFGLQGLRRLGFTIEWLMHFRFGCVIVIISVIEALVFQYFFHFADSLLLNIFLLISYGAVLSLSVINLPYGETRAIKEKLLFKFRKMMELFN